MLVKRKAKGPNDRVGAVYPGHHGPVYALQRHPMFGAVAGTRAAALQAPLHCRPLCLAGPFALQAPLPCRPLCLAGPFHCRPLCIAGPFALYSLDRVTDPLASTASSRARSVLFLLVAFEMCRMRVHARVKVRAPAAAGKVLL